MKAYDINSELKNYQGWGRWAVLIALNATLAIQLIIGVTYLLGGTIITPSSSSFQTLVLLEIPLVSVIITCFTLLIFFFQPKDKRIKQQQKDEYLKLQIFVKEAYGIDLSRTQTQELFHGYRIEIKNDGTEQTSLTLNNKGNFIKTQLSPFILDPKNKSQKVENNEIKTVLPTKLFN